MEVNEIANAEKHPYQLKVIGYKLED